MTWKLQSVARVQCDDEIHKGHTDFVVECPPTVAAEKVIRDRGWHGNSKGTVHQCPSCAARRLGAN